MTQTLPPAGPLLRAENILLGLQSASKGQTLRLLAERAARAAGLDAGQVLAALLNREALGSTGMGQGIAIPHAPVSGLTQPLVLLSRLKRPVDFEAIDDAPVDIVVLLLNPPDNPALALKTLAGMARLLRADGVLIKIRHARSTSEVLAVLRG